MSTKKEIIDLLKSTARSGITELIDWLESTDFFESPASTKYHGNYPGGLSDHSLNVYDSLMCLNANFREKEEAYSDDTIIIVALLHDLCKVNTHIEDSEAPTDAQMNYLKDLIRKSDEYSMPPKEQLTKTYVTKLIDFLKNGGEYPEYSISYKVKDEFPLGHGEKSVFLISKFIDLTNDEALAIRWHLGANDPGTHFFYPDGVALTQCLNEVPLVPMLISADYLSTWLVDVKK